MRFRIFIPFQKFGINDRYIALAIPTKTADIRLMTREDTILTIRDYFAQLLVWWVDIFSSFAQQGD